MIKLTFILGVILLGECFLPRRSLAQSNSQEQKSRIQNITQSGEVLYRNKKSLRFELSKWDRMVSNGMRSEMSTPAVPLTKELKEYDFSIFLPNDFSTDTIPEIVAQWHAPPDIELGETWRSPPIALATGDGGWRLVILWATDSVNTNKTISGRKVVQLGPYKKNEWTKWKFVIRFSYKEDGLLEVYKNDKLVLDRKGPNYFNDRRGPFFKYGIYKFGWNTELNKNLKPKEQDSLRKVYTNSRYKGIYKRVLYFGGVRIRNGNQIIKQ